MQHATIFIKNTLWHRKTIKNIGYDKDFEGY